jgi:hypothetical protein
MGWWAGSSSHSEPLPYLPYTQHIPFVAAPMVHAHSEHEGLVDRARRIKECVERFPALRLNMGRRVHTVSMRRALQWPNNGCIHV